MPQIAHIGRGLIRAVPLTTVYRGRDNSFGFLRLLFALLVLLAHSVVLGYDRPLLAWLDVPGLAVAGFFGISGFLITRSARRSSLPRYLWHRFLRIMPGLWACLLVLALVLAPVLYYLDHHRLHGLWSGRTGVIHFLAHNANGSQDQGGIVDVLVKTPYGQKVHRSVIDGSLWTLKYEIVCYGIVGLLLLLGVLTRARWLVLGFGVAVFGVLCWNYTGIFDVMLDFGPTGDLWASGRLYPQSGLGPLGKFPFAQYLIYGSLEKFWLLHYGFMFLAGAIAELFADRIVINDLLAVVALAAFGYFLWHHILFGPGLLAYEYLILWAGVRLPRILNRVGQRTDYSYGVYIYAFPVQQTLAYFHLNAWGLPLYVVLTTCVTGVLAYLSWHLVEKRALALRSWTPRWPRRSAAGRPPVIRQRQPVADTEAVAARL